MEWSIMPYEHFPINQKRRSIILGILGVCINIQMKSFIRGKKTVMYYIFWMETEDYK